MGPDDQADPAPGRGLFLSHSSHDAEAASRLHARLVDWGYQSLFLDSHPDDGIAAGTDWEQALYRNLRVNAAIVIVCSRRSMASPWCFAEITHARDQGKAIFPVKIDDCELNDLLAKHQVVDLVQHGEAGGYDRLRRGLIEAGLDPADDFSWRQDRPPYPGLGVFEEEDAGVYFGRAQEIKSVLKTLAAMADDGSPRLKLVIGSSGSGKSSLVRAGVLPRLKWKSGGRWRVVPPFRPEQTPILALAKAMARALGRNAEWQAIHQSLLTNGEKAAETLVKYGHDLQMAGDRPDASVLIVVDQFEELLADQPSPEAMAFHPLLRRALAIEGSPIFALATLRSDFLGGFQAHHQWLGLEPSPFLLGPMPGSRFAEVIEGPASRAGITFDPGLIRKMIIDAKTDDALPLLAFTLQKMYKLGHRDGRLTHDIYDKELKGIEGVVKTVVEGIKSKVKMTDEVEAEVRRSFFKLAQVNENRQFIRRPAALDDLPRGARPFLEKAVDERLLTKSGQEARPTVEVVHESLFHVWPELKTWLDQSLEFFVWKRRLQADLIDWRDHGRPPEKVLPRGRLVESEGWLRERPDDLEEIERAFVRASLDEHDRIEAAEKERLKNDQEKDRRLLREAEEREREQAEAARRQRKLARRLGLALAGAATLAIAALVSYGFARRARNDAQRSEAVAKREGRVAQVRLMRSTFDQIEQLRSESGRGYDEKTKRLLLDPRTFSPADRDYLWKYHDKLSDRVRIINPPPGYVGKIHSVAFDRPAFRNLAVSGEKTSDLQRWDLSRNPAFNRYPVDLGRAILPCFSIDGKILASTSGSELQIRDAETGRVARTIQLDGSPKEGWDALMSGLALAARVLETAYDPEKAFRGYKGHVPWALSLNREANLLASGGAEGGIRLWDLTTGAPRRTFPLQDSTVRRVLFTPDGSALASGHGNGAVKLWDAASGNLIRDFGKHDGAIASLDFGRPKVGLKFGVGGAMAEAGLALASGDMDKEIKLWDVASGRHLDTLTSGPAFSVSFGPDGRTLASGGEDQVVRIWDLADRSAIEFKGHNAPVISVGFTDAGKLASVGTDGVVRFWDLASLIPKQELFTGTKGATLSLAASPDGHTFASAGPDEIIRIRDLAADTVDIELEGHAKRVTSVCFGPDGVLYSCGEDGTIRRWERASPTWTSRVMAGPLPSRGLFSTSKQDRLTCCALSPDGKVLACGDSSGWFLVLDNTSTNGSYTPRFLGGVSELVSYLGFGEGGKSLICADIEGNVIVWDVDRDEVRLKGVARGRVHAASPDSRLLASGGTDGTISFMDLVTGAVVERATTEGHDGSVRSILASPDGRMFVSGGADGKIKFWDVETGELKASLNDHRGTVTALAFDRDGHALFAGGDDGKIRVWDSSRRDSGVRGEPKIDPSPNGR